MTKAGVPSRGLYHFLPLIALSFVLSCSRTKEERAPAQVATVVNASTTAGPNCSSAGDPFTGVSGTSSCTGSVAQATFQRAICACNSVQASASLTTDGYDATKGAPNGGLGASVAMNAGQVWSAPMHIGGDFVTPGNLTTSGTTMIGGNLTFGGTLTTSTSFTVNGNASVVKTLPTKNVAVKGTVTHVTSVAAPCDCTNLIPVASIVAAHRSPANDDASIGLSPTAVTTSNPAQIDLPCGNYYLSQITNSAPLTIAVHGHTALYVDGNINTSASLSFQVDPTATLDLFVAGTINASGQLTLGSTANPAHCRAYVAGSSVNLSSHTTLGCNLYAPQATLNTSGLNTIYGAAFVGTFNTSAATTLHYDASIQRAGNDCCTGSGCDDSNPCTVDACNDDGTCAHSPSANGTACTGSNRCNQAYTCQSGTCTGSNPVACTASDACHAVGVCDPATGACSNPAATDGTACNDGNACTQSDACHAGVCTGASPIACNAQDQCHIPGTCDPATGACSNPSKADGTTCNDGNACTQVDTCQGGACTGTTPLFCAATDLCHVAGACDPATGTCSNPPATDGVPCSDGNVCNGAEVCSAGACISGTPPVVDDANPCTADACDPVAGVRHTPVSAGTACSDGNPCNGIETCNGSGACTAGTPPTLDDGNACTADTCDPASGVVHVPVATGTACSAGDPCAATHSCDASGTCVSGPPPVLDDGNPCTADACDAAHGVTHTPIAAGTSCSDGNACNGTETCDGAGTCGAGTAPTLDDGNPCTLDSCDPVAGVKHDPIAIGLSCTGSDANCTGVCTAFGTCNVSQCVSTATCQNLASGHKCSADSVCNDQHQCVRSTLCPTDISDGNPSHREQVMQASLQAPIVGSTSPTVNGVSWSLIPMAHYETWAWGFETPLGRATADPSKTVFRSVLLLPSRYGLT